MTWVLVVRPTKGIEYQIYDEEHVKRKKRWRLAVLKEAAFTIFSNFVWWYITAVAVN